MWGLIVLEHEYLHGGPASKLLRQPIAGQKRMRLNYAEAQG
jgi:hypothetical protein